MGGASRLRPSHPTGQECPWGQVDLPPSRGASTTEGASATSPCSGSIRQPTPTRAASEALWCPIHRRQVPYLRRLRSHATDDSRILVSPPLVGLRCSFCCVGGRWPMQRWRSRVGQVFHLIEQPIDGICSGGPRPVSATCFIASKRSRRAFGIGVVREASSLPRYCNSSCALKPKKSGVH
jgi:hypothetical protein